MSRNNRVELVWEHKYEEKPSVKYKLDIKRDYIFPHRIESGESLFACPLLNKADSESRISGRLIQANNLQAMQMLQDEGYKGRIDLIYIDPPYLSQKQYSSKIKLGDNSFWQPVIFKDKGPESLDSYLNDLYIRLKIMKELLSEQGSIFVHLDWHVSHYVKIILDEIFGVKNFINEIVWCYGGGGSSKRHFHRKHDLIFWYSRSDRYIFNPQFRSYSEGTMARGLTKVKGSKYKLRPKGALMQDWWTDINKILSPTAYENVKFPTQKPMALLERIIASASNPDSLVADFYSGSGTTAAVCEKLNRRWVVCDENPLAITTSLQRLVKNKARPLAYIILNTSPKKAKSNNLKVSVNTHKYNEYYRLVNIKICDYQSREEMEIANNMSFLSHIQFWDIDLDYNGDNFNSHVQIIRDKVKWDDAIPASASLLIPYKTSGAIAVRVFDIWGDSCTQVIQY